MSVPYTDPNANKPGYYYNYDVGQWLPSQNIVPQSPYPGTVSHANEPGYYFNYDTGTWLPVQNIVPQSPYPPAPPASTGPTYNGSPVAQVQPASTPPARPGHTQPAPTPTPTTPAAPPPLAPGANNTFSSNPNAPANPYAPTNYGMNRNPYGNLGQQQSFGRNAPQPNSAGLGLGTNWNNPRMQPYNPPVSIPTGEFPTNPTPPTGGTPAPALPSYAVPNGRFPQPHQGMSEYLNPNTGLHQWGPGQNMVAAPPGSPVAFMPRQDLFSQFLQGMPHRDSGNVQGFGNLRGIFGGHY